MNEADDLVEQLQTLVGRWPHGGRGAVVESVTKCGGDDLSSLEIEVEFRDATSGAMNSRCFGEVVRFAGIDPGEVGQSLFVQELAGMIVTDLDEFVLAID